MQMPETCWGHHIQATTVHMYVGQLPCSLCKNELKGTTDIDVPATVIQLFEGNEGENKYWRSWIR